MHNHWHDLVHSLTLDLVRRPSVTNTRDEQSFADHLHALLARHPYFQAHPDQLWTQVVADDPQQRRNVYALVRGAGTRTVLLAGHYDVVSVEMYGALAEWAFDPPALLPRMIAELERSAGSPEDQLALDDLRSGDFLPGRGVLDMKSGLAAGIACVQRHAETDQRIGNLLLVATPDEEDSSYGMRGVAERLNAHTRNLHLNLVAAINLDAIADRGDGRDGRAVCLGSAGKLLPSVYVVGRPTHAGYPFDGINANHLVAEVTRRLDGNVELCDYAAGEWTPPPANLKQADEKHGYDVTIPGTAWCTYNVLSYERGPLAVLDFVQTQVRAALTAGVEHHREQAQRYADLTGRAITPIGDPLILTFAELKERALHKHGASVERALAELTAQLAGDSSIDLPEASRRVTGLLWHWSGLAGPAAVIGFASLYYPRVQLDPAVAAHARLHAVAGVQATAVAQASGMSIKLRPFFPAISDMSFLGGSDSSADLAIMSSNTPLWGSRIRTDYAAIQQLNLPTVNIGPWGRDYHQRTERVHMPYAFGVMPELIWRVATAMLNEE